MVNTMVRLQIDLSEAQANKLETLMKELGVKTKKEIFNYALSFLEWAVEEKKAGRKIASVDEEKEKYKELVMPLPF